MRTKRENLVFYFLYYWSPHGRREIFFSDWYSQVIELCPIEIEFNVEDLGDISEGVDITVTPVYLEFIQIRLATQGEKE